MKTRIWIALVAGAGVSLAVSHRAAAAPNRMEELMAKARAEALAHPGRVVTANDARHAPDFGTQTVSVLNLEAYAFQGASAGDQFGDDGNGYRYLLATT